METKKSYITPSLQVIELEATTIMAASGTQSDMGMGGDPFKPASSQSSLGTPVYSDIWEDIDETNGYIE